MKPEQQEILVVDDNENNRDLLQRRLQRLGYRVAVADSGGQCLEILEQRIFDLVLLDIMMPDVNGYEVLETIKGNERLSHIPVIMVTALDEVDSVVKCLELGAEDYLTKPFNAVLLKARVSACLERKAMQDREMLHIHQVEAEMQRSDELLEAILPAAVVKELKETNKVQPRLHEDVAVMICDIVGFTPYCESHQPEEVVANLGLLTEAFEEHTLDFGLEKINSIGDEFLAAGGLSEHQENQVLLTVKCGLEMIRSARAVPAQWDLRVGIHLGPVIAGVVGRRKFLFGLWGDTVNTASRVQSYGEPGRVYASKTAWEQISHLCTGEFRGNVEVKGKGAMELFRIDRVNDGDAGGIDQPDLKEL